MTKSIIQMCLCLVDVSSCLYASRRIPHIPFDTNNNRYIVSVSTPTIMLKEYFYELWNIGLYYPGFWVVYSVVAWLIPGFRGSWYSYIPCFCGLACFKMEECI